MSEVFERFTDPARKVVVLAQEEARMLGHSYIGTEHLLLGLVHGGDNVGGRTLESLGISLEEVRRQVEEIIGTGESPPTGHIPFTPRAKKILELSLREAPQLGHNYIGSEHLLLGLLHEGEGVGAQVLVRMGATLEGVRGRVLELIRAEGPGDVEGLAEDLTIPVHRRARPGEGFPGPPPRCPHCGWSIKDGLRYLTVEATAEDGDHVRPLDIAYCIRCGTAISGS